MNDLGKIDHVGESDSRELAPSYRKEAHWFKQRLDISSWFQRNAPPLGELYAGAVKIISDASFPGRVRFVSHAVREIRNRLPDIISGTTTRPYLQYKNRLDKISEQWQKAGFPLDGSRPISLSASEKSLSDSIAVPIVLYDSLSALIRDHNDVRERPAEKATRLFVKNSNENAPSMDTLRPVVDQWLDVTEWFMKKTHESSFEKSGIEAEELESKFELFETTLGALLRGFFTTVEELDEILEEANT